MFNVFSIYREMRREKLKYGVWIRETCFKWLSSVVWEKGYVIISYNVCCLVGDSFFYDFSAWRNMFSNLIVLNIIIFLNFVFQYFLQLPKEMVCNFLLPMAFQELRTLFHPNLLPVSPPKWSHPFKLSKTYNFDNVAHFSTNYSWASISFYVVDKFNFKLILSKTCACGKRWKKIDRCCSRANAQSRRRPPSHAFARSELSAPNSANKLTLLNIKWRLKWIRLIRHIRK